MVLAPLTSAVAEWTTGDYVETFIPSAIDAIVFSWSDTVLTEWVAIKTVIAILVHLTGS